MPNAKKIQKWDHQKTVEMRSQGWQLIEADVWASSRGKKFRICFQDGTMAEGYFPGKERAPRGKGVNIGTWIDQDT